MDEKKIFQAVASFLEERNMCAERIDMDEGVRVFREEMLAGLNGEESSLQMIPTYISVEGEIPKDQPVLVLDAGGTNFRVAEIRIDSSGDPVISGYKKNLMPGSKQPVGREEFFNTIVDYMQPLLDERDIGSLHVGFCFSYPT